MPVFTSAIAKLRPGKRLKASAAPRPMPMIRAAAVAEPEISSERKVISHKSRSPVPIIRNASRSPSQIKSMSRFPRHHSRSSASDLPASGTKRGCPNFSTPNSRMIACASSDTRNSAKARAPASLTASKRSGFTCITW